jgi:hypothetical protein
MSRNKWEWLFVLALVAAFVGYCNYQGKQQQQPAAFEQHLIGTWTSEDLNEGPPPIPITLAVQFDPDHTYLLNVTPGNGGKVMSYSGTWQIRTDARIAAQESTRVVVMTGEHDLAGEYVTMFAGNTLHSDLLRRTTNDWRKWQRAK